jgi:FdhD protein
VARSPLLSVTLLELAAGATERARQDEVAIEEPLEIRVAGEALAVTMRTPGHDHELAAGLLLSEGIVSSADQLGSIAHCGRPGDDDWGNVIEVSAAPGCVLEPEAQSRARRGTLTSSACGVCGRKTIDDLVARSGPVDSSARVARRGLAGIGDRLRTRQPAFERSGGLHAAGLCTLEGELLLVREDIGRHNAVDKIVGRLLLDRALPASDRLLVVSGRASFEIVQKAVAAGIVAVAAISAPSSLAIATAARAGVLLCGFCRGEGFNVYAGRDRLV